MNKRFYTYFGILVSLFFFNKGEASDFYTYNMPSAHVANMFRYGDVEPSLFTGCLNIAIPLYLMDDPDFNFDISLKYNSEGFKPRKHSGIVGYSWFLETGGCIMRETRKHPDETSRKETNINVYNTGMLHYLRSHDIPKEAVFSFNDSVGTECDFIGWNLDTTCNYDVDYVPDIFHYNFCGYHGSFMINNSGRPVILAGDYVTIDLSDVDESDISSAETSLPVPQKCSKIIIRTKDGYKYEFGGDLSSVSFSIAMASKSTYTNQYPPVINSWYLRKITAPSHRTTIYYYRNPLNASSMWPDDPLLEYNEYYDYFAKPEVPNQPDSIQHIKYLLTKTCILDSIVVSGTHVVKACFYNSVSGSPLYASPLYGGNFNTFVLDSIKISCADRILRRITLSYENRSHTGNYNEPLYNWRFLKSATISGVGTYTMEYNHTGYPSLFATNNSYSDVCDYYGFWKDHNIAGLLSQIVYPTGGIQTFEFQPNTYGQKRYYTQVGFRDVRLVAQSISGTTSGARISQIKSYLGNQLIQKTQYLYNKKGTNISSGVFYDRTLVSGTSQNWLYPNELVCSLLESHIGYSYVEEIVKDSSNTILEKNAYTFDTGPTTYSSYANSNIRFWLDEIYDTPNNTINSGMLAFTDELIPNGHLLAKDYYVGNVLKRSHVYQYNGIPMSSTHLIPNGRGNLGCTDTIVIMSNRYTPIARKLYVYPDVILQKVTVDYNGNDVLYQNTCFQYDSLLRVKTEYDTDSESRWHFTRYTFPDDIAAASIAEPFGQLVWKHRLASPIEIIKGFEKNGMEYITGGQINVYLQGAALLLPSEIQERNAQSGPSIAHNRYYFPRPDLDSILIWGDEIVIDTTGSGFSQGTTVFYPYLGKTMDLDITTPITNYQSISLNGSSAQFDSRYKMSCEYDFDYYMRPIKIAPHGKMLTTYTWNGIYPCTITTGNQTSFYTFIPYVGLESSTDPRGITTFHSYDVNGKLIEIYQMNDNRKEIFNSYMYHIKTE